MGTDHPRLFPGWSSTLRGRHEEAIAELQKAVVDPEGAIFPTAALGQAYAVAGHEGAAREVLCRLLARSRTRSSPAGPTSRCVSYPARRSGTPTKPRPRHAPRVCALPE